MRQLVERTFEVIGEAARRLVNHDPGTAARISDLRRMVAFRNVLAHGYDEINSATVWGIIRDYLPVLKGELDLLMREAENGPGQ